MNLNRMAWRNIWRNRRRTGVTIAAMSLAFFVMVQYGGLVQGYMSNMRNNILDLELGDGQVHALGYLDDPSIHTRIGDPDAILTRLDAAGVPAAGRLLAFGLAAAGDASAGVQLRGVDVARDAKVSKVGRQVTKGEWLDPAEPNGVVLGRRLARNLGVQVGGELLVLAQAADGSTANDLFKVRGILKGISEGVDRGGVYMIQSTMRELFVVPQGVHQLIVRDVNQPLLEVTMAAVSKAASKQDVRSWRELLPTLSSMLDAQSGMVAFMFLIVYAAIGVVLLNAMLMAVFERIREFGVLKAIGLGPMQVLRIIVTEAFLQAGLAIVIGGVLALPSGWYLANHGMDLGGEGFSVAGMAWDSTWRAAFNGTVVGQAIGLLLFVVGVAVTYPALKAAFIRPVTAIRHQ